jgi:hypothetical protein
MSKPNKPARKRKPDATADHALWGTIRNRTSAARETICDAVYASIVDLEDGTDAQLIVHASKRCGKKITIAAIVSSALPSSRLLM